MDSNISVAGIRLLMQPYKSGIRNRADRKQKLHDHLTTSISIEANLEFAPVNIAEQAKELAATIVRCAKCPALVSSRTLPVCGYGDIHPLVVFVGEAPGRLGADLYGIPFTGDKTGILLQRMLIRVNLSLSEPNSKLPKLVGVYLTNIVRCNPKDENSRNRTPTKVEIDNCNSYLRRELELLRPPIVVPLGVKATQEFLGRKVSTEDFYVPHKLESYLVFPMHHPSFITRGGGVNKFDEEDYYLRFVQLKKIMSVMAQSSELSSQIHPKAIPQNNPSLPSR
jgi:uracil-DNA glycosylase family 4